MRRLLAVDDNEHALSLVRTVASALGFAIETINISTKLMTAYVRFKPDVIVLDVLMPYMDGFEILNWLADVEYNGRVVLVSGDQNMMRMALALGETNPRIAVSGLSKRFRLADLRAVLE